MTPVHQAAIETLAGRALTPAEIALAESRNDSDLAESLSAGRTRIAPTPIGYGTVLAVMAPNGGAFLDAMSALAVSDPNIKWGMKLLDASNFDIGNPVVRAMLQGYADALPDLAAGITALLAVAEVADPVSVGAVSDILNSEG